MATPEENEVLTRTGPDTAMGRLLRRYWIPALLSEELPAPDGPPLRLKLLGERLVAFRDTQGRVGLVDERCPHRTASLFFGRNEECGLRCVYHGWKFDVDGNCVDLPSEPWDKDFKRKIKITAYPCVERGDVVWAYMGPPALKPAVPDFEWASVPASHRITARRLQQCNWFQAYEGGWDTAHLPFLHRGDTRNSKFFNRTGQEAVRTLPNTYEFVETPFGFGYATGRDAEDGATLWSASLMFMPSWKIFRPFADADSRTSLLAWIPVDDENCMIWSVEYHPTRPLTEPELAHAKSGTYVIVETLPGGTRPLRNRDNDYLIDRALQSSGASFTGIKGLGLQDSAIQESMGPIADRTREHLTRSDREIVLLRRHLLRIVRCLDEGAALPGMDASGYRVLPAVFTVPRGGDMVAAMYRAIGLPLAPAFAP